MATATKIPRAESKAEAELALQLRLYKMPHFLREHRFDSTRRWRLDFARLDIKLAVEVEGLTAQGGRHQTIGGFKADLLKYDEAMRQGWTVYRCSYSMIKSGQAIETIKVLTRLLEK